MSSILDAKTRFKELVESDKLDSIEQGSGGGLKNLAEMSSRQIRNLISLHSTFIFDCDGVLWRGMDEVRGSAAALGLLHDLGKQIVFVTNNATKTRKECEEKARKLGFAFAKAEQFVTAGYATALTLREIGVTTCYVVGSKGLHEELCEQGITALGLSDSFKTMKDIDFKPSAVQETQAVSAVVCSFDGDFSYYKMAKAAAYLRYGGAWRKTDDAHGLSMDDVMATSGNSNDRSGAAKKQKEHAGVLFVATNPDQASPLGPGGLIPGGGAFLSFLETASGRKHDLCCGKPSKELGDAIRRKFAIERPSTALMWGVSLCLHSFYSCAVPRAHHAVLACDTYKAQLVDTGPAQHGCCFWESGWIPLSVCTKRCVHGKGREGRTGRRGS